MTRSSKRVGLFKQYGVFRAIDYMPSEVVLHFDLTRFRSEGIAGYVFAEERPGTVPFYRWFHPRDGSHYYTIQPIAPDRPNSVSEGIACHVYDHPVPEAVPFYHWRSRRDDLYTRSAEGRMPAEPATGLRASPATSIAIRSLGPCHFTGSSTPSATSTFTLCTHMPSSQSKITLSQFPARLRSHARPLRRWCNRRNRAEPGPRRPHPGAPRQSLRRSDRARRRFLVRRGAG